jgi:hypothetical protein
MADVVNHPAHYNEHPSGVECIVIAEWLGFNLGNAFKYVWRAGRKGDNRIEDLSKALWYVRREQGRAKSFPKSRALINPPHAAFQAMTRVMRWDASDALPALKAVWDAREGGIGSPRIAEIALLALIAELEKPEAAHGR